ncbi:hypothetical protein GCM10023191_002050 [Actinoallomurus oryzae]|uniref:Uncharacterized protein n=1 Tax=Actinoallomurus oryzae TaxID=502180 RepID=A0ABP8P8A0_9ACTN
MVVTEGVLVGDWFQTIVDVQVTSEDAGALATEVRDWLSSAGVVSSERTDCVLGSDLGHPPGPRADEVVDASGWSDPWQTLWTNGMDITTGRTVFDGGQGEPTAVACPHCAAEIELVDEAFELDDKAWAPFQDVVHGWSEGRDVILPCPTCSHPVEPTAWKWADGYFAFGRLGFTFWNWPPLRPGFVDEFTRRLRGHRTVLIAGKL